MLIFVNMTNSQSDETSILDKHFLKFFPWILHFDGGFTVTFLRKQKKK